MSRVHGLDKSSAGATVQFRRPMRIMWWSNAPWAASGYGVQTKLFVPRLAAEGHQMAICANAGLQFGTIEWEGIRVFPGHGPVGNEVVGLHSRSWEADVTISLMDAWVVRPEVFAQTGMRWVPWFPVDSDPVQPMVISAVRGAKDSIVFSRFAERVCHAAGMTPLYVPHGVDTKIYRPSSREEARAILGCPRDKFLLGMVAANRGYPSRKSIPQVLQAFARFSERHRDAILYLHTPKGDEPWGERAAINLVPLIEHLQIRDRIIMADEYSMLLGFPDSYMANIYNAMDGLLAPSMGEGFGVPILEAQACGCPVLVGDWTSMSELCFGGYKIPEEQSEFFWTDLNGGQRLPRVSAIEAGMEYLYAHRNDEQLRRQACIGASAYDADRITREFWVPTLSIIEDRIRTRPARNRKAELLLRLLEDAPPGPVVEIGCLRQPSEVPSDGHSTLYLAKACAERGRAFSSFDRDPLVVDVANRVLEEAGLPLMARVADGVEALGGINAIAFLYLDSSDDPADTFRQLAAAELAPGAIVMIDDAQQTGGQLMGKATLVVKHCGRRGLPFDLVPTEPGFAACVLRLHGGKMRNILP